MYRNTVVHFVYFQIILQKQYTPALILFQLSQQLFKILRKRCAKLHVLSRSRMNNPQHPRMQGLTMKAGKRYLCRSINLISKKWMTNTCHMHADSS